MKMNEIVFAFAVILVSIPLACAFPSDESNQSTLMIVIDQPVNSTTLTNNTFILNASMSLVGDMVYSVDDTVNETGCNNCSGFETELALPDGSHYITVYGTSSGIENSSTVYFTINTTRPVITIVSPINTTYNTSTVDLNVTTKGIMLLLSYSLDSDYHFLCGFCDEGYTELDVEDGSHHLIVYAHNMSEVYSQDVYFTVNTTIPTTTTTTIPTTTTLETTTTTIPSPILNFTLGFQHLPQLYASGEVTEEELIEILQNYKLNPGILNRLIMTGKLTNETITVILETQFLPVGILNRILWYFGLGHNHLVEAIFDQYNLTDEQFIIILTEHDVPPGTIKHMISAKPLTEGQINILLDIELNPGILKILIERQTLTEENIEKILETQEVPPGLMKNLIENQILTEVNVDLVIEKSDNPDVLDKLLETQELTEGQKGEVMESLPPGLQKKYNITISQIAERGKAIGRQVGRGKVPEGRGGIVEESEPEGVGKPEEAKPERGGTEIPTGKGIGIIKRKESKPGKESNEVSRKTTVETSTEIPGKGHDRVDSGGKGEPEERSQQDDRSERPSKGKNEERGESIEQQSESTEHQTEHGEPNNEPKGLRAEEKQKSKGKCPVC